VLWGWRCWWRTGILRVPDVAVSEYCSIGVLQYWSIAVSEYTVQPPTPQRTIGTVGTEYSLLIKLLKILTAREFSATSPSSWNTRSSSPYSLSPSLSAPHRHTRFVGGETLSLQQLSLPDLPTHTRRQQGAEGCFSLRGMLACDLQKKRALQPNKDTTSPPSLWKIGICPCRSGQVWTPYL